MAFFKYYKDEMALRIGTKTHFVYWQCPFATWWKARKFFIRPKFRFYFGPVMKFKEHVVTEFGEFDDYEYRGVWPAVSTEWLKWNLSKNKFIRFFQKLFPITIYSYDIGWKDKYNSPRFENNGYFIIFFGRDYNKCWQFSITVSAPKLFINNDCTRQHMDEHYWETILDYLHYTKCDSDNDFERLLKCRKFMRKSSWSSPFYEKIDNDKYKIINTSVKKFQGHDYVCVVFDSYAMRRRCTSIPEFNTSSEFVLTINYKNADGEDKQMCLYNDYVTCKFKTYETQQNIVKLWFAMRTQKQSPQEICELIEQNDMKVEYRKYLDIGPSFKDEYLNERTQNKIIKYYKQCNQKYYSYFRYI